MGIRQVSQAEFSRLCACSREAVGKAGTRMELLLTPSGKVPLDRNNLAFKDKVVYRKIAEQLARGRVLPEWAVLVGDAGKEQVPLWWYPPHGLDENDAYPSEAAWGFDFDVDHEKATRQEDGVVFTLRLEFDPAVPPLWLRDALAAGARRRARGRARTAAGKQRARA